jgi:hypothetical protein
MYKNNHQMDGGRAQLRSYMLILLKPSHGSHSVCIICRAVHSSCPEQLLGLIVVICSAGSSCLAEDITTICLYAEPGVVSLYERLGFQKDPAGIKGMAFQRKSEEGNILVVASA